MGTCSRLIPCSQGQSFHHLRMSKTHRHQRSVPAREEIFTRHLTTGGQQNGKKKSDKKSKSLSARIRGSKLTPEIKEEFFAYNSSFYMHPKEMRIELCKSRLRKRPLKLNFNIEPAKTFALEEQLLSKDWKCLTRLLTGTVGT